MEAIIRTFNLLWRSKNGFEVKMQEIMQCFLYLIMKRKLIRFSQANLRVLTDI